MFLKNWMSYISDDAKITKIAMPGSHNSGTMGMSKLGKCQNGSLYSQYNHGVRAFDIRLKADKKGNLFIGHGILKGMPAECVFESLRMILNECENEFLVISIQTYMNQKFGPVKLSYNGNSAETSRLIRKYLSPEKYALTDFGDINELTIGDIRTIDYVVDDTKTRVALKNPVDLLQSELARVRLEITLVAAKLNDEVSNDGTDGTNPNIPGTDEDDG